jgi:plastocyanin
MFRKYAALSLAIVAATLAACVSRPGGGPMAGSGLTALPPIDGDLVVDALKPGKAVGENLPTILGTIRSTRVHNEFVGGFTQTRYSQTLSFEPGTVIKVWNLSKTISHTFNVVMVLKKGDGKFPVNPALSTSASGTAVLGRGYASGIIKPQKSVTIKLMTPGTYLIGCAFHYQEGMRDVIVISKNGKPGPEATPPSSGGTASPSPAPTKGGGGGW